MRFCLIHYFRVGSELCKGAQHRMNAKIFYAGIQFAVRKSAGAALPELDI